MAELFQWRSDADAAPGLPSWREDARLALADELSDVLSYVIRLADVCDIDLGTAFLAKLAKNRAKYPADAARGSAAKYTEYDDPELAAAGVEEVRQCYPPERVVAAYERTAARVEAMRPSTPPPEPRPATAQPAATAPDPLVGLSVQQRAKARAEAKLAEQQAARELDSSEPQFESVDDLFCYMEFGGGGPVP